MTRCAYHRILGLVVLLLTIVVPSASQAQDGLFSKGRMNVSLGAGGGSGTFTVAGNFGYFVMDGLRPGIATRYTYQKQSAYSTDEVEGELSLRYYLMDADPIAPFVVVDTTVVHLSYSGSFDEQYTYFGVGAGAGLFVRMAQSLGIEIVAGAVHYLGVNSVLTQSGAVPEGIAFRWNVGLALFF